MKPIIGGGVPCAWRRRELRAGDSVYACLVMSGRVVAEATFEGVGSFSELLCRVRQLARRCRGLARLHVCNRTRGWSFEQPLMLYRGTLGPGIDYDDGLVAVEQPGRSMYFPWEDCKFVRFPRRGQGL